MPGIPVLTPPDLMVLALSLGPSLLLGVPALLAGVRQPEEVAIEPVADGDLPPAARRWLGGLDARFAQLGFRPMGTWRATNLPKQRALTRSYVSSADSARGGATTLLDVRENSEISESWIEFTTFLADDTVVGTANLRRSRLIRSFSRARSHDAPGVGDPVELRAIHERNCAPYMTRGVIHASPDPARWVEEFREFWRRDIAWRCGKGLFRSRGDGMIGLTLRGAVFSMLDAMWPIGSAVGARSLLMALLVGIGLPLLACAPLVQAAVASPIPLGRPAALLAAAVLVAPLGTRALWWAPILTWLGARAALGTDAVPAGALGWVLGAQAAVAVVSTFGARFRARA
jgi:hypothetical protein